MASPLIQGGLEIPIKLTVKWDSSECMEILKEKVKKVEYPIAREYKDSSKDILNELGVKIDGDDDDDECDDCEGDSDCGVESEDDENVILVE
jgi:hypothetical protein